MERMRVDTQVMRYQKNYRNGYGETAVTGLALDTTATEKRDRTRSGHNCHGGLCFGVIFFCSDSVFRTMLLTVFKPRLARFAVAELRTSSTIRGGGVAR